ncbi:MAG: arsenate reductase ArsC [Chloroflexi bacterium]|nr:arsenate reductase ArsC [Chloroflexota bacterium]
MSNQEKLRVLILCTANSARSQMAEGALRWLAGDRVEVFSAGTRPSSVNLNAIRVMREIGVDISHHRSKSVQEFLGRPVDVVITVCDNAAETCPVFPGKVERIHWSFPDPAAVEGDGARLAAFRLVRDGLIERFKVFLKERQLSEQSTTA